MYMDLDDNASESEKPVRKPLSQTTSAAQFEAHVEAGFDGAAKMPKASKRKRKSENSEKIIGSSRCRPDYSLSTESSDEERALRRRCSTLKKECSTLKNEITQIKIDCEKLESENREILRQLAALNGSAEDPYSHTSTSKI